MKTIHPIGLARLIATHQPFDLIDVRTKEEFDKTHISGARSIPLPELRASKVLRDRKLRRQSRCMSFAEVVCWLALPAEFLKRSRLRERRCCRRRDGNLAGARSSGRAQKMVPENCYRCSDARSGCWIRVWSRARYSRSILCPAIDRWVCRSESKNSLVRSTTDAAQEQYLKQTNPREEWAVPDVSRLAANLDSGEDIFLHPHHRTRFAECH